jgi:hypothetical protein
MCLSFKLSALIGCAFFFSQIKAKSLHPFCPSPGVSIRAAKQPQNYNGPDTPGAKIEMMTTEMHKDAVPQI